MDILVSMIVPAYNVEKYIIRCLESIKKQSYGNLEIIIINDGSTDNTLHLINDFIKTDNRFKVYTKNNGGLSSARNYGMELIKGKYFTFVDSDDWIHFDYIKSMVELAEYLHSDIVSCDYTRCDSYMSMRKEHIKYRQYKTKCADALFSFKDSNFACAKLMRTDLWKHNKVVFPEGGRYEDIGTMYKIYDQCHNLVVLYNKFYYYFVRSGSITSDRCLSDVQDKLSFVNEMNHYQLKQDYSCWGLYRLIKLFGTMSDLYKIKNIEKWELKKYRDIIYGYADGIKISAKEFTKARPRHLIRLFLLKTHLANAYFELKKACK